MIEIKATTMGVKAWKHDTIIGVLITTAMRKSGIPIAGEFALATVAKGRVEYFTENDFEDDPESHVWRWYEDANDRKTGEPSVETLDNGLTVRKYGRHKIYEEDDDEL